MCRFAELANALYSFPEYSDASTPGPFRGTVQQGLRAAQSPGDSVRSRVLYNHERNCGKRFMIDFVDVSTIPSKHTDRQWPNGSFKLQVVSRTSIKTYCQRMLKRLNYGRLFSSHFRERFNLSVSIRRRRLTNALLNWFISSRQHDSLFVEVFLAYSVCIILPIRGTFTQVSRFHQFDSNTPIDTA